MTLEGFHNKFVIFFDNVGVHTSTISQRHLEREKQSDRRRRYTTNHANDSESQVEGGVCMALQRTREALDAADATGDIMHMYR